MALPDSVRVVIGARVGRLGHDAERVLSLAAVIGRDFDLDVLARAAETSEDELLDILDAATAAALVRELADTPGHYSFAHALIQHTLYEDLGRTRRARAHRQVAEALEDLCGDRPGSRVGELARHWFSASQPVDLAKALDYSRQAADAALAALAPADALRYYTQALDLYARIRQPRSDPGHRPGHRARHRPTPDRRPRLSRHPPRRRSTGRRARRHRAPRRRRPGQQPGHLLRGRHHRHRQGRDPGDGPRSALPDDPDRALVLATLCAELTYGSPLERRQALADEALALAEILRRRRHHRARPQQRVLPAPRSATARTVVGPDGRRPAIGPSGSVTRSCCSGPLWIAPRLPPAPRTSTRWTAAWRPSGRSPSSSISRP